MSSPADLLLDGFGRVPDLVRAAVDGLTREQLAHRLDPQANSIGWLAWHLARIEDASLAEAFGGEQVWTAQGFYEWSGLPLDAADTGFGHGPEQVEAVLVRSADFLTGYYDAVAARTAEQLRTVTAQDLDRVVDDSWDPPVTLGTRLVSVLEDVLQHVGQAGFVRGVITRGPPLR